MITHAPFFVKPHPLLLHEEVAHSLVWVSMKGHIEESISKNGAKKRAARFTMKNPPALGVPLLKEPFCNHRMVEAVSFYSILFVVVTEGTRKAVMAIPQWFSLV